MSMDSLELEFPAADQIEADIRTPNAYLQEEAEQLCCRQAISCLDAFRELRTEISRDQDSGLEPHDVIVAILEAAGREFESDDERDFVIADATQKLKLKKQSTLAEAIVYALGYDTMQQLDRDPEILTRITEKLDWSRRPDLSEIVANWDSLREGPRALDLDRVVALRLLKNDFNGDFNAYRRWYAGSPAMLCSPADTVAGMQDAGESLADAIDAGKKIAVFCDYDVDGTTAGEVFRRSLSPYEPDLHYGYADAQAGFGLTEKFVRDAHKAGAEVLVTLDCGSADSDKIALARDLGMETIVVDHHDTDASNPADHHLNPKLVEPASSSNTGAQLAWKLGAAVQIAREGHTRPEQSQEAMYLAGLGALADMGPVLLPENRAFFWHPHRSPAPGIRALAKAIDEDPEDPNETVITRAIMNLPKRTPKVEASLVGKLLAAEDEQAAQPIVKQLIAAYADAKPVKAKMEKEAREQVGEATYNDDGTISRPDPERNWAIAVLEDYPDYSGYTGTIAPKLSKAANKPSAVFARKGKNEAGEDVYRFSCRLERGAKFRLGRLLEDPEMLDACTLRRHDEHGDVVEAPSIGGHAKSNVVSGSCSAANLKRVQDRLEEWAKEEIDDAKKSRRNIWPKAWDGPDAFVSERLVSPTRLDDIERQASRLGPFSTRPDLLLPQRKGRPDKTGTNREIELSVKATLKLGKIDPDNERFRIGELRFEDGSSRECRFPADVEPPKGAMEWIVKPRRGPYWLRKFFPLPKGA